MKANLAPLQRQLWDDMAEQPLKLMKVLNNIIGKYLKPQGKTVTATQM